MKLNLFPLNGSSLCSGGILATFYMLKRLSFDFGFYLVKLKIDNSFNQKIKLLSY